MEPTKILLIEDVPDHAELVIRAIREVLPEVEIDLAETGEEGVRRIQDNTYRLIIIDYALPCMNGLEVMRHLMKALPAERQPITTIMLTGHGNEQVAVEAMKLGAVDYLPKNGDYLRSLSGVVRSALAAPIRPGTRRGGSEQPASNESYSQIQPACVIRRHDKKGNRERNEQARFRRRLSAAKKHARKLEELNRVQAEFVANVSHEFRTPLNGILGYTELLHDGLYGSMTKDQLEVLDHIRACGNHLLDLVNEVLDLSRLKKHQLQLELELVPPVIMIEAAAAAVQPLARQRNLGLVITCEPDLPMLRVDFRRIYQVLLNLLSNAIKFTNEGRVEVGVRREGDSIRFHVKDTGIGIAHEFSSHIFQDFRQQNGASTRPFGGVGLGLSLSKRLVELHGGEIGYVTKEQQGTEFYFYIPLPTPTETSTTSLKDLTKVDHPQDNQEISRESPILHRQDNGVIAGQSPILR